MRGPCWGLPAPFNGAAAFRRWQLGVAVGGVGLLYEPSMEPPPFDGGNYWCVDPAGAYRHPSMEPPPFDGGNQAGIGRDHTIHAPSMEPPPFDGGNVLPPARLICSPPPFNGAAAFRRWQFLGGSPAATYPAHPSMEPPPFDGGNYWCVDPAGAYRHPSMEPPPFDGGNQAGIGRDHTIHAPSMEPPPFDGGNVLPPARLICSPPPFNGAAAFRRWQSRTRSSTRP